MSNISQNLKKIHHDITAACQKVHRNPADIKLVAVTKQQPLIKIEEAMRYGVTDFGENYVQEAVPKIQYLTQHSVNWHFIGQIQANKTRIIAENFNWVHTITSPKIAQRLAMHRPDHLSPLNTCLAINIDHEATKSGIGPNEIIPLAEIILSYPRLKLRGLFIIPKPQKTFTQQRRAFAQIQELRHQVQHVLNIHLDTLSMGMSSDFVAAITEGTTMIRLGTAIFGART